MSEWKRQEGEETIFRTCAWSPPGCHPVGCGLQVHVKDGVVTEVEGDPEHPITKGSLCPRCLALTEYIYHPDRIVHPMKRAREDRGLDKWERCSWDEATDLVANAANEIIEKYGAETIAVFGGTGREANYWYTQWANLVFGSPNAVYAQAGWSCYGPRISNTAFMLGGGYPEIDYAQKFADRYEHDEFVPPEVVVLWGKEPLRSNPDGMYGHAVIEMMRQFGTKLICVDPRMTWLGTRSEIVLQVKPGTDTAMAMAWIHVMDKEGLVDREWIDAWTYGYDELAERCKEYPVELAAEIAGVEAEDIRKAARLFASGNPSTIQWGLKVDQTVCGIPLAQGLLSMGAICGDIDVPGGMMIPRCAYDIPDSYGCGMWNLSDEMLGKMLGVDTSPLHALGFDPTANGDTVLNAIETGEPYPIRMLFIQSTNTFANMSSEAPRVYRAMRSVDYNVVVDVFMTPTAVACADIVLPCGMSCERNSARVWWWPLRSIVKVGDYYEAKSDEQIILELGKRLNPRLFPWETDVELMTWWIQSGNRFHAGWPHKTDETFPELREKVIDWPDDWAYRKYELGWLRDDGQPGFNTNTGRCELYNTLFEAWGFDPLPYYEEPPESPVSTPELFEEYPYVLTTGARTWEYFHSEERMVPRLRESHPDPLVDLHPDTAAKIGVTEGDWIWVENMRGKCKQRVRFNASLKLDTVRAEHGWWFPEQEGAEPNLFGVFDSNINNLTVQGVTGPTLYGAPYANQICKIYPVTKENDCSPSEIVTREGGF